jgi:hypothetical protein
MSDLIILNIIFRKNHELFIYFVQCDFDKKKKKNLVLGHFDEVIKYFESLRTLIYYIYPLLFYYLSRKYNNNNSK